MGYGEEIIPEAEERLERMWSGEKTVDGERDSQVWRGLKNTPTYDSERISKSQAQIDDKKRNLRVLAGEGLG